jgi:hypothetical protein
MRNFSSRLTRWVARERVSRMATRRACTVTAARASIRPWRTDHRPRRMRQPSYGWTRTGPPPAATPRLCNVPPARQHADSLGGGQHLPALAVDAPRHSATQPDNRPRAVASPRPGGRRSGGASGQAAVRARSQRPATVGAVRSGSRRVARRRAAYPGLNNTSPDQAASGSRPWHSASVVHPVEPARVPSTLSP